MNPANLRAGLAAKLAFRNANRAGLLWCFAMLDPVRDQKRGRNGKNADLTARMREKSTLDSVGATFADVIKINRYLTDIRAQLPILREVRDSIVSTAAPPASTTVEVSRLAADAALFEVEAIVALPPR